MKTALAAPTNTVASTPAGQLLNKVPAITAFFWIIKVLSTTVGETAADFLNVNLNWGLTGTTVVMSGLLLIALVIQLRARRYVPSFYWLTVVLISIVGTLVTDNLVDNLKVPLETTVLFFGGALLVTFGAWYASERTLSIHAITSRRRELFYWAAILCTFALGTAAGDLMAERLGLGYLVTGLIIATTIASVSVAWRLGLDAVVGFWTVYILTRPLGASIGDYLSQTPANGGLGLGATMTSVLFLGAILLTIGFLSVSKRDVITHEVAQPLPTRSRGAVIGQLVAVVAVLTLLAGTGYSWRRGQIQAEAAAMTTAAAPLGDLTSFRTIEQDTLRLVQAGDLAGAKNRVSDLETAWDNAAARLKPMNAAKWTAVDTSIDAVLRQLRATNQDPAASQAALETALIALQ